MSAELKIREALAAGPTKGNWDFDSIKNEGEYSNDGPDSRSGFSSFVVIDEHGNGICDTSNSDLIEVEEWADEESAGAIDLVGEKNAKFIAACSPAAIAELLAELDRLRATPAPGAPAGFKPVPIKVTKAMQDAWDSAPSSEDSDADFAGAYQAMLDAAPGAPGQEAVSWQVRRTDGSPLACWETCTKDLYDLTLSTGRYCGFENGPPCEVRALAVIGPAAALRQTKGEQRALTRCASDRDGDCVHRQCPQNRDNEPHATGRSCPLWVEPEEF